MTPTTAPARAQVAETIRDHMSRELSLDPAEIGDGDVLKDLPGADSLRLMRLVARLERHWDTEFTDDDIFGAVTFDDLVSAVESGLAVRS
jgi:acyl carrier protein